MGKDIIVRESNIHGKGVFALRDFKKGDVVLKWNLKETVDEKTISSLTQEGKKYISEIGGKYFIMQSPEKYINYSCNPNTHVVNFCDVAIKNIKREEEINSDYLGLGKGSIMKCNCGSVNCKGMVEI